MPVSRISNHAIIEDPDNKICVRDEARAERRMKTPSLDSQKDRQSKNRKKQEKSNQVCAREAL